MAFTGFSKQGIEFLSRLPSFSKSEFASHHEDWDQLVFEPTREFVEEVGARLRSEVSPTIQGQGKVNGSISPIHRDLRFTPDKSTIYKDHLLLNFWDGIDRKTSPTLRIRLASTGVGFAVGSSFSNSGLQSWRVALHDDESGERFTTIMDAAMDRPGAALAPAKLKRVPAPYPADHPRAEFLCHKSFQLRWLERLPACVESAEFVSWCSDRLASQRDLHLWLKEFVDESS